MADKKSESKPQVTERMYQLLVRPIVTEKTTQASASNTIVFEVSKEAGKPEIAKAVEALYKVDVVKVNTLIRKGKVKRHRTTKGRRSDMKMAFVRLAEGHSIDVSSGV